MKVAFLIVVAVVKMVMTQTPGSSYLPPSTGGNAGANVLGNIEAEAQLPVNYEFTYQVQEPSILLDFGHSEARKDETATGNFHVLLPDGRTQFVDYIAGPQGYMPTIRYEGTASFPAPARVPAPGAAADNGGYKY